MYYITRVHGMPTIESIDTFTARSSVAQRVKLISAEGECITESNDALIAIVSIPYRMSEFLSHLSACV